MSTQHPEVLNTSPGTALLLPIEWHAPRRAADSVTAAAAWLEALLPWPGLASLGFVLTVRSNEPPVAGLVVHAMDPDAARSNAQLVRVAVDALNSWQGLGDPVPFELPESSTCFDITQVDGPGRSIFNHLSAPWVVAATHDEPTTMHIELRGPGDSPQESEIRCAVTIYGSGPASELVADLVAADPPGKIHLAATPRSASAPAPELTLPLNMISHLVSSPARIPQGWPTQPVDQFNDTLELIEDALPPHVAIFGGTGLGKTTLFEHLIAESLDARRGAVVICPHGDLAARGALIATNRGIDFQAVDFADTEHPTRWNLSQPPAGVDPMIWVNDLVTTIRSAWSEMPDDYFGPVWVSSMRVALSVLIRCPYDQRPLTELPELLTPPLTAKWKSVLRTIGDPELEKELQALHEGIRKDQQAHWGLWVRSKLEPLVRDQRVRNVIGHVTSTVDLDSVAEGRSLMVSAPASALGDAGANLLVATMLTQIWHLLRRTTNDRPDVDLFVDEVHRIPSATLNELLAEGRKFGVRLRLTTQSPTQLQPTMRDAILTNSGAVGTFRTGPREAALLEPLFPTTPAPTLTRLDRHWLAITNGEHELVGPTKEPLVPSGDRSALTAAHRQTHDQKKANK